MRVRSLGGLAAPLLLVAAPFALSGVIEPAGALAQTPPDSGDRPDPRSEARRIADRAYERYEAGAHGEALALFRTAHRLYPNARLLLGIGKCLVELHRPVEAIDALEAALEHPVAPLDERLRAETTAQLADLRQVVGLVELRVEPGDALVLIDGEPADARARRTQTSVTMRVRMPAGVHRIEARSAGHMPVRRDVTVEGGTAITEVTMRLPRDPTSVGVGGGTASGRTRASVSEARSGSDGASPWPWIGLGAGAALAATVIVLIAVTASSGTPEGNPGSLGYVVEVLRHDRR